MEWLAVVSGLTTTIAGGEATRPRACSPSTIQQFPMASPPQSKLLGILSEDVIGYTCGFFPAASLARAAQVSKVLNIDRLRPLLT